MLKKKWVNMLEPACRCTVNQGHYLAALAPLSGGYHHYCGFELFVGRRVARSATRWVSRRETFFAATTTKYCYHRNRSRR